MPAIVSLAKARGPVAAGDRSMGHCGHVGAFVVFGGTLARSRSGPKRLDRRAQPSGSFWSLHRPLALLANEEDFFIFHRVYFFPRLLRGGGVPGESHDTACRWNRLQRAGLGAAPGDCCRRRRPKDARRGGWRRRARSVTVAVNRPAAANVTRFQQGQPIVRRAHRGHTTPGACVAQQEMAQTAAGVLLRLRGRHGALGGNKGEDTAPTWRRSTMGGELYNDNQTSLAPNSCCGRSAGV